MPSSTASRSQRQRPGAKVFKSPKDIEKEKLQKLDKLLVRATDLESQLSQPNNDDTKAYKLRAHYCEVLSDVLILNPKLALDHDCFQRLWRNCFYKPISIWRQRVSKEKRKRSPNLATSQEGYKSFLSEAIKLFDYLVIQYLSKLCPSAATTQPSQTQDSSSTTTTTTAFESSQATEDSSSSSVTKPSKSLDGVVRGLYKLYIFLGDLHRYAEAYNKAEINYLNASKLGPGLGNPYNQLAVVAFTKEAYCVSLYWYSRSILATHEKFSTSSTNLERLFEKNHEYLMEHGRETIPTVLSLTTTSFTNTNTTTNNNNNNNNNNHHNNGKKNNKKTSSNSNSNMVRAQKAAASKSCLAHFVDLHYYFYQQQQLLQKQVQQDNNDDGDDDDDDDEIENKLKEKISNVIASLKSLVEASGFSDSLLCKIVVINNFSLERSKSLSSSERLSKELLFSIGIVFAEHIEGNLMKVLEKVKASAASNNMPKTTPSIRYLIPLEMLLDFVLKDIIIVDNDNKNKNKDEQQHQKKKSNITTTTEDVFWKRILVVGNLIKEIVKGYKIEQNFWHGGKCCAQIKEYQLLKGYRPFSIVNKEYMSSIKNKDGYIEPVEAIEVLELSSTSTQTTTLSQDTAAVSTISTGTGSNGGIEENKAKLLRMLEICDSLAASSSAAPLTIKTDDGSYVYCQKNEGKIIDDIGGCDEEDEEQEGGDFDMQSNDDNDDDDSDDEAGDVILIKSTAVGIGTSDKPLTLPIVPVPPGVEISVAAPPPRPSFSVSTENKNKSIETTLLNAIMDAVPPPTESEVAFANEVAMTDATEKTSPYRINNNMVHHHSPAPSLPDVVKPPPGFGGSVTMPGQLYNTLTYNPVPTNPALSLLPLHGLAPAADHSSSLYQLPQQQQQHSIIPGLNLPPNSAQASLYPSNNVGSDLLNSKADSSRIFGEYGDIQTANPFVVDPAPSLSISNAATCNGNHNSSSVPNNYENNNTDVTKFLNAGLLNSLWMDESKTNNPWAEK